MDFTRIFQTFHECVFCVFGASFVRILDRVVVFHDSVCKIPTKFIRNNRVNGEAKKILWISGKKFAKVIKQTPIRSNSSVEKSQCPNRMPKQNAQTECPNRQPKETTQSDYSMRLSQTDFPVRLPNQTSQSDYLIRLSSKIAI